MKLNKIFLILSFVYFSVIVNFAESIPDYLQEISVTIRSATSEGSGVLFTRTNKQGELINFVWTCGHVIDDLRSEREVISPDGAKRMIVEFKDAKIIKQIRENDRTIGRLELDAEVIKYSNPETGEDLALLKLRKKNFVKDSTRFYLEKSVPELGVELYHVGSLLGQLGANSMTSGIYSQHGRIIGKKIFDQTTVAAFPGSSGGGVFLKDGRYIGMVVRGAGETFNLIVPIRRIYEFAKRTKIEWSINQNIEVPNEEDFFNIAVEDIGREFKPSKMTDSSTTSK